MIVVNQGTSNDNKIFLCTTDSSATIGSSNITYSQVTPANVGTVTSVGVAANKVSASALNIDGATDIGADLTTSDLILVDDGASGTNRKAALSRVVTLMTNQGFTTDDPTALAIALG
jgi:hypothetical protein